MKFSVENLPPEVLVHIFTVNQDGEPVLGLEERARGEAVCRRWRAALAGNCSVEEDLCLDGTCPAVWQWLIKRQARIPNLTIDTRLYGRGVEHLLPALLTACAGHLEALNCWAPDYLSLPKLLPQPHLVAPHLRTLVCSNYAYWDTHWMTSLAQLPRLQHLELRMELQVLGEAAVLPSMGALTSLRVEMLEGFIAFRLSSQPALQHLTLLSIGSHPDLRAAFPSLKNLCLSVDEGDAALDFGGMAQLCAVTLFVSGELEGAGTLVAATMLKTLSVSRHEWSDEDWDYDEEQEELDLERPWGLELLRSLPQSLRGLKLEGIWSHGVAATLAQATQLAVLSLVFCTDSFHVPLSPFPPAGAPLWRSLRALDWLHGDGDGYGQLPEGLESATSLHLLQLRKYSLSSHEEDLVLSLPALQRLYVPGAHKWGAAGAKELKNALQPRMRRGQSVHAQWLGGKHSTFLEAALAELSL